MNTIVSVSPITLEEARPWVGRRLILKRSLEDFAAGTRCIVMCAVDFGEGLLLWIKAENDSLTDVGQFELDVVEELFTVAPGMASGPGRAVTPSSSRSDNANRRDGGKLSTLRSLGHRLLKRVAGALQRVAGLSVELARSVAAAQEAALLTERYMQMSDRELAVRGLMRSEISDLVARRLSSR